MNTLTFMHYFYPYRELLASPNSTYLLILGIIVEVNIIQISFVELSG